MDGGNVLAGLFVLSMAMLGIRKMWGIFDAGGAIRTTAQKGLASKIAKWLS